MSKINDIENAFIQLLGKIPKNADEMLEMDRLQGEFETLLREEQSLLLADLSTVGIHIKDVWSLVNSKEDYAQAIPVLVSHLKNNYHAKNLEGIIRSLGVKPAQGIANKPLLDLYEETPNNMQGIKWAIGNSLEVIVEEEDVQQCIHICKHSENGKSRQMFVASLKKFDSPEIREALRILLVDKDVQLNAIDAIGKKRSKYFEKELLSVMQQGDPAVKRAVTRIMKL